MQSNGLTNYGMNNNNPTGCVRIYYNNRFSNGSYIVTVNKCHPIKTPSQDIFQKCRDGPKWKKMAFILHKDCTDCQSNNFNKDIYSPWNEDKAREILYELVR